MALPLFRLRFNFDDAMTSAGVPAFTHPLADVTDRWIGDQFGYGARHIKTDPNTLAFDPAQAVFRLRNDDGLFTPLGVSDILTPSQLNAAHAFDLYEVGGDTPLLLWRGTIQRQSTISATAETTAAFNAFEVAEKGSRAAFERIEEVPRTGGQSQSPKSLFRLAARRMGTDVDDSRYEDPPAELWRNSVIRWPEPRNVVDFADWTMLRFFLAWAQQWQQPVFTLRDGRIGSLGLRSTRSDGEINLASIDIRDGQATLSAIPVNNVAIVGGIDLLEGDAPVVPPAIPRGFREVPGTKTDDSLTFRWDPVAAAAHYVVQIGTNDPIIVRGGTQFTFTNLIANTRYSANVRSVGSTGLQSSPARAETSTAAQPTGIIEGPDPIPSAVTPRVTSSLYQEFGQAFATMTIVWDAPQYATFYDVEVSIAGNVTSDSTRYRRDRNIRATSVTFRGLLSDTEFTITLRVGNATGENPNPVSVMHRTGLNQPPVPQPFGIQIAESAKTATTARLTLTFGTPSADTTFNRQGVSSVLVEITGFTGGIIRRTVTSPYAVTARDGTTLDLPVGVYSFRLQSIGTDNRSSEWTDSVSHTISAGEVQTAPTNVAADATGPTSIDLTWTNGANSDSHSVQRKLTSDATWPTTWESPDSTGRKAFTGLSPATSYDFRVRSTKGTTHMVSSAVTESTEAATALGAPTNLRAIGRTTSSISIAFTAGRNATSHRARIKLASATNWGSWADVNGTTWRFDNLSADTLYDVEVQAQRTGMTPKSATLDDVPTQAVVAEVPGAPTISSIVGTTPLTGASSALAAWTAPATGGLADGYEYRIRRGALAYGSPVPVGDVLSATIPNLLADTGYGVQLRGTNSAGDGAWSSVFTFTTPARLTRPGAPTLIVVTPTSGSITAVYTAPTTGGAAASYEFRITETAGSTGSGAWEGAGTALSFTKSGLKAETRYWVEVRARNAAGVGPSDGEAETTGTAPLTAPAAITNLAVPNPTRPATGALTFTATWTLPVARAEAYQSRLRAGTGAWSAWADIPASALTLTSSQATFRSAGVYALADATGYTLEVRATNAAGNGTSDSDTFTTPAALSVGAVTGLRDTSVSTAAAEFTWTDAANAEYHEYRLGTTGGWTRVPTPPSGAQYKLRVTGLTANTSYAIQVRGRRGTANGTADSDTFRTLVALTIPTLSLAQPAAGITNQLIATIGAVAGAEFYEYRYGVSQVAPDPLTGASITTVPSWSSPRRAVRNAAGRATITGLQAGTNYGVQARARRGTEFTGWSATVYRATRSALVGTPSVTVTASDDDELRATWTSISGANFYFYRYREVGTTAWSPSTNGRQVRVGGTLAANITGLDAATEYEVEVRAQVGAAQGSWGRGTATTLPAAPVLSSRNVLGGSFEVTWPRAAGAASYQWSLDGVAWHNASTTGTGTASDPFVLAFGPPYSVGDVIIIANANYDVRVRSRAGSVNSKVSNIPVRTRQPSNIVYGTRRRPPRAGLTEAWKSMSEYADARLQERGITVTYTTQTATFGQAFTARSGDAISPTASRRHSFLIPFWLGVPVYIGTATGRSIDLRNDVDPVGGFFFEGSLLIDGTPYAVWTSEDAVVGTATTYTIITEFTPHLFISRRQSIGQLVSVNILLTLATLPIGGFAFTSGLQAFRLARFGAILAREASSAIPLTAAAQGVSTSVAATFVVEFPVIGSHALGTFLYLGLNTAVIQGAATIGYGLIAAASLSVPSAVNTASEVLGTPRRDFSTERTIQSSTSQADRLVNILVPINAGDVTSITRISATNVETEELSNFTRQDGVLNLGGVQYAIYSNTYSTSIQAGDEHRVTTASTGWR